MQQLWENRRAILCHEAQADPDQVQQAARELQFLCAFCGLAWPEDPAQLPPYDSKIRHHLIEALMHSGSQYAAVLLSDLLGLNLRFNVPGIAQDQNWSARLPMTLTDLQRKPWQAEAGWLRSLLQKCGRAPEPAA
jgi:4-alpha-glucanotransferase